MITKITVMCPNLDKKQPCIHKLKPVVCIPESEIHDLIESLKERLNENNILNADEIVDNIFEEIR